MIAGPVWAGNYFQGVSPTNVPWSNGIVPYLFDTNYTITVAESNVILAGLREWELAAKVKFVPYTNQNHYVLLQFTNDGSGTGFYLNYPPGASTAATMMLHGLSRGLMCHEGGHLFGLQHEHQRIDRNNYIEVNFTNIIGGTNGEGVTAFLIDSNSTSFGPYDLQSVMHYTPGNFSIGPGFDSFDPLPPYSDYYHKLGNLALSIGDRAAVSNLYGPPATPLTNTVTTTADGGFGSLRAAIYYASDHPGTTIKFNIPNSDPGFSNGVFTIYLVGELPPLVSAGTVIDGTTQPGYTSFPVIALDGSQVSPEAFAISGLHFYGTNCTVRALAFDNFAYAGIQLLSPDAASNHVEGCYLGVKPDGTNAAPNNFAGVIFQFSPHDNFIGGTNAAQGNVISGNLQYGILINDTNSDHNIVRDNYIGLDASGSFAIPNGYSGIGVWYDPRNTIIGGTNAGWGNIISGNLQYGVYLAGTNNSGVVMQNNGIGTDATGGYAVPNGFGGIGVFDGAHNVTIGGPIKADGNLISGNTNAGIYFVGVGVTNNVVQGNLIGVNLAGTAALPNSQVGIFIYGGASANAIGGANPHEGNLLSGNLLEGVYLSDTGTTGNLVQGNYVGTDITGSNAIPNGDIGVGVWNGASGNLIVGNLISGNTNYGVVIGGATANTVQGNFIGTDITGTNALGNAPANINGANVELQQGAVGNFIGGAGAGAGNVIAFSGGKGVLLFDPATTNNAIRGNSIFGNTNLGIDLGNDGVTPNHVGFLAGPNDFQNYPVITTAAGFSGNTVVAGMLNSLAGQHYFVDVYRSPVPDPSGYGEGKFYVGSTNVTTDGSGNGTFSFVTTAGNYAGQYLTATAVSAGGDTSEFSLAGLVTNFTGPLALFTGPPQSRTNGFAFTLLLQTNFNYHVQAATNLAVNPVVWTDLTNFLATNSLFNFVDRNATNYRARFYRVVSP